MAWLIFVVRRSEKCRAVTTEKSVSCGHMWTESWGLRTSSRLPVFPWAVVLLRTTGLSRRAAFIWHTIQDFRKVVVLLKAKQQSDRRSDPLSTRKAQLFTSSPLSSPNLPEAPLLQLFGMFFGRTRTSHTPASQNMKPQAMIPKGLTLSLS